MSRKDRSDKLKRAQFLQRTSK